MKKTDCWIWGHFDLGDDAKMLSQFGLDVITCPVPALLAWLATLEAEA